VIRYEGVNLQQGSFIDMYPFPITSSSATEYMQFRTIHLAALTLLNPEIGSLILGAVLAVPVELLGLVS